VGERVYLGEKKSAFPGHGKRPQKKKVAGGYGTTSIELKRKVKKRGAKWRQERRWTGKAGRKKQREDLGPIHAEEKIAPPNGKRKKRGGGRKKNREISAIRGPGGRQ